MLHGVLSFEHRVFVFAALGLFAATFTAADARVGDPKVIVAANGQQIIAIASKGSSGPPSFDGDSYDFQHQIGALIDGVFKCFSEHMSGMDDNTVLFDGLSEFLDPYLDGTQPAIFEFETFNRSVAGGMETDAFFNSFSGGEDLFPEGFEDPETNTPLDAACLEIGINDTLGSNVPVEVISAIFEASGDNGSIIPNTDITSFFSNPWDGRLSVVFPGMAGQGINGMVLDLTIQETDPANIFSDGFESGDASAWSDTTP